jgi:hypothetical protein
MEEDGGVLWENYFVFPVFTLSLPVPETHVMYKTCLSDTRKEMLTKMGEIFVVFVTTVTSHVWTGH